MPLTQKQIATFQQKILSWYEENKRDLPWRRDREPYHILVSEVMLQQTQVSRVIPKYREWLQAFPTLKSLADAQNREVLLHWSGLGYNSRALRLKKLAETIIKQHKGQFPRSYDGLIQLPGIGRYTANAMLCFAFDEQVVVVDTNIRKVIMIEFIQSASSNLGQRPISLRLKQSVSEKEIEETARKLLPIGKAYDWNQALMDYASAMLKEKKSVMRKQAPFRSSDRYYRGRTMKLLVRQHTVFFSELWHSFESENPISEGRLWEILTRMEKDGLLRIKSEQILIV